MDHNKTLTSDNAFKILNKISLFDSLSSNEKKELANFTLHFVVYDKYDFLTDENAVDKRFFILLSGGVNIVKGSQDQLIATLDPGEVIGEVSFLTGVPRTASVVSNTLSSVLVIDDQLLAELNHTIREKIKDQLILRMAQRLNMMNSKAAQSI